MDGILESQARALAALIKDSPEYAEYLLAKAAVSPGANPAKAAAVNDYITMRLMAGQTDAGDPLIRAQEASEAYYSAAADVEVRRFFEAERAALELICGVIDIITADCPIEPPFDRV